MLRLIVYIASAYLCVGAIIYIWGTLLRRKAAIAATIGEQECKSNLMYRHLAHSAQAVNFLVHSVATMPDAPSAPIGMLYAESVQKAFEKTRPFITTGSPHSRAFYLRNFAWFYPDLLNEKTVIDRQDLEDRVSAMNRSLSIALDTTGDRPYTTTIVPLTARKFAAVNYVTPPSDSLLGILSGIQQLLESPAGRGYAVEHIARHERNIERQLAYLASQLDVVIMNGKKYRLFDVKSNKSSATDTRNERMRFVVNANIWTTFVRAEELGLMEKRVFKKFDLDRTQYKRDILELFGSEGYMRNSLEDTPSVKSANDITLDFAHIRNGFWDFSNPEEVALFKNTADVIFADPTFHDISNNCYFVSNRNPDCSVLHKYTTPAYHGRTVWSSFNVEFADRLLDLADVVHDNTYRYRAQRILAQLKSDTERNGGYPELIDANGAPYRTWIYKSAVADSWFPRFAGVWHKAFGKSW